MLNANMSGTEIAAFAASLRGRRPDLADLLFNATPANIRAVNAALAEEAAEAAPKEEPEAPKVAEVVKAEEPAKVAPKRKSTR